MGMGGRPTQRGRRNPAQGWVGDWKWNVKGEYGVNIQDAAKIAHEKGKGIRRKREYWEDLIIIPTNTCGGCYIDQPQSKTRPMRRWQPELEDLLADDWQIAD